MVTDERQVQVVGLARRRQYSIDEKAQIVGESFRSSVAAVCRRYNLAPRLVYTWRSRYKGRGSTQANATGEDLVSVADTLRDDATMPVPAQPVKPEAIAAAGFVHVATVREETLPIIRVKVQGDVVAEFPMEMDPLRLAAVVRALQS